MAIRGEHMNIGWSPIARSKELLFELKTTLLQGCSSLFSKMELKKYFGLSSIPSFGRINLPKVLRQLAVFLAPYQRPLG